MSARATNSAWAALRARPYLTLVLFVAALYLPWIGAIPMDDTLEGNRLEAAREMLQSGDWLVPRVGGAVYLSKPPLHPWTIALASVPFGGVTVAIGRFISALFAIAVCLLVLAWGRRELGARAGLFAALATGMSLMMATKAVRAELETELAFFTTAALFLAWDASWSADAARTWRLRLAAGLALGAAVLVKGPPPVLVFASAVLAAAVARVRRRAVLATAGTALAIALCIASVWVVAVCERIGVAAAWDAFQSQFLERIVRAGRTNVEPVWFYGPALLAALAPATLLMPCLALVWPARVFQSERSRVRAYFLWGAALGPLVLFSLSSGKETRYLLPTVPAWTLLIAWGWVRARVSGRFVRWRALLLRAGFAGLWIAPVAWLAAGWFVYPQARALVVATSVAALVARSAFAKSALVGRPALLVASLLLVAMIGKIAWAGTALAEQRRAIPVEQVGRELAARLAPGEPWALIGGYRSWWHFAVGQPCVAARDWSELEDLRSRVPNLRYALTPAESAPPDAGEFALEGRWTVSDESYLLMRALR